MWTRPFLDPTGDHCDVVQDVAVGSAGDIVAVGFIDRTPTCNDSEGGVFTDADVVIQKRSATGSLRWTNVLTDPGRDNDEALGVDVAGRQIYVSGERNGSAWVARLDDRGRFDWQRRWGAADLRPRAMDVSASPWATVYVVSDRHRDPTSVGGLLGLRAYTANGDLQGIRTMRLMQGETGSGVVASSIGAVYVTARIFAERGDLWRMPV
jgi:hypothetical protein